MKPKTPLKPVPDKKSKKSKKGKGRVATGEEGTDASMAGGGDDIDRLVQELHLVTVRIR